MNARPALEAQPEYEFQDVHFEALRALLAEQAGIALNDSKRELVYGRLVRRIRALGLDGFDGYCRLLRHDPTHEIPQFINAITTNLTAFFRENHHFDFLRDTALEEAAQRNLATRRLRFWSAGCSSGEEAYSVAMTLLENLPQSGAWDIQILATDIDSEVLARARSGRYAQQKLQNLTDARRKRWFTNDDCVPGELRVNDSVKALVQFSRQNLVDDVPFKRAFDGILCRNVAIYFSKDTQRALFKRLEAALAPGGYLFLGHAESLCGETTSLTLAGQTTYRRANDS